MNVKMVARLGGQAVIAGSVWKSLRQARTEGDRLKLLDAVVHALAVATAIALIVREVRQQGGVKEALDLED